MTSSQTSDEHGEQGRAANIRSMSVTGGRIMVIERPVAEWIDRVRAEYLEMPGLSLTRWQMRRLWSFDARLCDTVVNALVVSGFLYRRANRTYARADRHV
jgi:hypothetical protein